MKRSLGSISAWIIGSAILAVLLVAVACGSDDAPVAPVAPPPPAAAPAPPPPAAAPAPAPPPPAVAPAALAPTLKVALNSFGHNSLRVWLDGHFVAIPNFDVIIDKNSQSELVPESSVVNRWESSPDFKEWKFWVNPAVKFHDGRQATTMDLQRTIEMSSKDDATGGIPSFYRNNITRSEVVGDHVELVFSKPRLSMVLVDMTLHNPMLLVNAVQIDKLGWEDAHEVPNLITSGPFRITKFVPSDIAEFEAAPDYWGEGPFFDSMELNLVGEDATRIALLQTGAADIVNINSTLIDTVEKAGMRFILNPAGVWVYGMFHNLFPPGPVLTDTGKTFPEAPGYNPDIPWLDVRVREALNISIDRDQLMETFYRGKAEFTNCPNLGTGTVGFEQCKYKNSRVAFDPARAKQLLADAGHAGMDITVRYEVPPGGRGPEIPELSAAIASMWEQNLGVKTTLKPYGSGELTDILENREAAPFVKFQTNSQNPFGGQARLVYFAPPIEAADGRVKFANYYAFGELEEKWRSLWNDVEQTATLDTRAEATARFSEFARDDWGQFFLFMNGSYWGVGDRIAEWEQVPGVSWPQHFNRIIPR